MPLHWFQNISSFFHSIGIKSHPNHPCVFTGTLLDGQPPIYVGLYVDNFAYFSTPDGVENCFKNLLNIKYTVSYDDCLELFLGIKFTWYETEDILQCHVHQEVFILDLVDRHQLLDCNKSTRATPFWSGLPVDNILPSSMDESEQTSLTKLYQQIIGDLNWLSINTLPDISTIILLLTAHSHKPAQSHFDAARHVVKYLASTPTLGLYYTSDSNENLHAYVHFLPQDTKLAAFYNANWGLMDDSVPKPSAPPIEKSMSSLHSLSGWLVFNSGSSIAWGCERHKNTA